MGGLGCLPKTANPRRLGPFCSVFLCVCTQIAFSSEVDEGSHSPGMNPRRTLPGEVNFLPIAVLPFPAIFGYRSSLKLLTSRKAVSMNSRRNQSSVQRSSSDARLVTAAMATVFVILATGCATTSSSNTARTGSEQLLISEAIDRSISKVRFRDFAGHKVFINETYLEGVDKGYLVGSLRHGILKNGGAIVGSADAADIVLEARSGGIGTDTQESFVGIPSIGIPGLPIELPEVKLASRNTQMGTAKIGLVCYDAKTGEVLGDGGKATALTHNNDSFYLGIGPFKSGTLLEQRENAIGFNGVGGSMFSSNKRVAHSDIALVKPKSTSPAPTGPAAPFGSEYQIATRPDGSSTK